MRPLLVALLLVTAVGCRSGGTPITDLRIDVEGEDAAASLTGTAWSLQQIQLDDGTARDGGSATLQFGTDGRASANSCNVCNGTYAVEGATLQLGPLGCTRRACRGMLEMEHYLDGPLRIERTSAGGDRLALRFSGAGGEGGRLVFTPATER